MWSTGEANGMQIKFTVSGLLRVEHVGFWQALGPQLLLQLAHLPRKARLGVAS